MTHYFEKFFTCKKYSSWSVEKNGFDFIKWRLTARVRYDYQSHIWIERRLIQNQK